MIPSRSMIVFSLLLVLSAAAVAADPAPPAPAAAPPVELKDTRTKASYALGVGIGRRMQQAKLEGVDIDVLARAIRDVFGGGKLALTDTEIDTVINAYVTEQFRKPGEDFLAANKAKPGVQVTKSGLQYKVLKQGDGPTPKASDQVKTHYKGTLIDGKEFDSSIARGEPAVFPVGGVIAGWTEALQLMKVGDKWELYIPSDLAYGERGSPPKIPPHSALIFEIELLGIEK